MCFLVVTAVDESPSSTLILEISADITASADPTCSDEEKSSLETQASAVDEAIETVSSALEVVQLDLTIATGTTASASALSEAAAAEEAAEEPAAEEPAAEEPAEDGE